MDGWISVIIIIIAGFICDQDRGWVASGALRDMILQSVAWSLITRLGTFIGNRNSISNTTSSAGAAVDGASDGDASKGNKMFIRINV